MRICLLFTLLLISLVSNGQTFDLKWSKPMVTENTIDIRPLGVLDEHYVFVKVEPIASTMQVSIMAYDLNLQNVKTKILFAYGTTAPQMNSNLLGAFLNPLSKTIDAILYV